MNPQSMRALLTTVCLASILYAESCHLAPNSAIRRSSQNQEPTKERLTEDQVTTLLRSEFGDLFRIDDRNISPSFLIGDFNGDGAQDIAVSVGVNRQINPDDKSKPPFFFEKAYGPGPSTVGEDRENDGF